MVDAEVPVADAATPFVVLPRLLGMPAVLLGIPAVLPGMLALPTMPVPPVLAVVPVLVVLPTIMGRVDEL